MALTMKQIPSYLLLYNNVLDIFYQEQNNVETPYMDYSIFVKSQLVSHQIRRNNFNSTF